MISGMVFNHPKLQTQFQVEFESPRESRNHNLQQIVYQSDVYQALSSSIYPYTILTKTPWLELSFALSSRYT